MQVSVEQPKYDQINHAISFLETNEIAFERHDHPAVFTVEEVTQLVSIGRGARTKNLFVRDKKGRRHILIVIPFDKKVDLLTLGELSGLGRLSFASNERLWKYLGVQPGSVTVMGVINDMDHHVEVIIDEAVWDAPAVRCHPLINTCTVVLEQEGLRRMLHITGHDPMILNVPSS